MEKDPLLAPHCTPCPKRPPDLACASSVIALQDQLTPCSKHVRCSWLYTQYGPHGAGDTNPCRKAYRATAESSPGAAFAHSTGPIFVSMFMHSSVKPIITRHSGCSAASLQDDWIVHCSVPRSNLIPLAGFAFPLPRAGGRGATEGSAHQNLPRSKAPCKPATLLLQISSDLFVFSCQYYPHPYSRGSQSLQVCGF